jgi:hypothetical protein
MPTCIRGGLPLGNRRKQKVGTRRAQSVWRRDEKVVRKNEPEAACGEKAHSERRRSPLKCLSRWGHAAHSPAHATKTVACLPFGT